MEKIWEYVKRGKGWGLLFLLAYAVLLTIFIMFNVKTVYNALEPQIGLISRDFLPLTVVQNKIVDPINTYKRMNINLGSDEQTDAFFPIVLDTRDDVSEVPQEKQGLFVMKDMVYVITQDQIRKFNLSDGVLDEKGFNEILNNTLGIISAFMAILFVIVFFIAGLIKAGIAMLFGLLGLKFMKSENVWSTDAMMRLCCLLVAGIEFLSWFLNFSKIHISGMSSFIFIVFIELILLSKRNQEHN